MQVLLPTIHRMPVNRSYSAVAVAFCFTDAKLERNFYSCKFFKKKSSGDSHEPPDTNQINFYQIMS